MLIFIIYDVYLSFIIYSLVLKVHSIFSFTYPKAWFDDVREVESDVSISDMGTKVDLYVGTHYH